jgi:hypothetical protein
MTPKGMNETIHGFKKFMLEGRKGLIPWKDTGLKEGYIVFQLRPFVLLRERPLRRPYDHSDKSDADQQQARNTLRHRLISSTHLTNKQSRRNARSKLLRLAAMKEGSTATSETKDTFLDVITQYPLLAAWMYVSLHGVNYGRRGDEDSG